MHVILFLSLHPPREDLPPQGKKYRLIFKNKNESRGTFEFYDFIVVDDSCLKQDPQLHLLREIIPLNLVWVLLSDNTLKDRAFSLSG